MEALFCTQPMYLEKLEMQGFKTFAQKTILEFPPPRGEKRGIAAIVGPNGSGKSNSSEAVRWALGEQSMKLLRGKKSEDVIFAGTEKKARAGFAEVSLTLNNEDRGAPIDYTTLVITRRLFRDGNSEYLIGGQPVRLADIQILLAQANFGQRTYSVIGQGMIDHILVASAQERKEFFDEAAGVKQFQIKRSQAATKLEHTGENLTQAEQLLREIEPRLRSLSRQVRRLEEREPLRNELMELGRAHYGSLARELAARLAGIGEKLKTAEARRQEKTKVLEELRKALSEWQTNETRESGFLELQKEYEKLADAKNKMREELLKTQNAIAFARLQNQGGQAVPAGRVLAEFERAVQNWRRILGRLAEIKEAAELTEVKKSFESALAEAESALSELKGGDGAHEERFEAEKQKLEEELKKTEAALGALREKIKNYSEEEKKKKGRFFSLQKDLERTQDALHSIDRELGELRVEAARSETQRDGLYGEIKQQLGIDSESLLAGELPKLAVSREEAEERIRKIKTQLEVIGSIDPEVIKEHTETKERHDFLKNQIEDLTKASSDLETGIKELDRIIEERADASFKNLNREFEKYFKLLFGGGKAGLLKTEPAKEEAEAEEDAEEKTKGRQEYVGIEIMANPPGKRVRSINMLSGGERALTSIALICAIMSLNPSPFVVLDEVDAALDEVNSIKFAEILDELSHSTQFIVITHNRATMEKANILYGVTMGEDGVSRLLSLKLEEVEQVRKEKKVKI